MVCTANSTNFGCSKVVQPVDEGDHETGRRATQTIYAGGNQAKRNHLANTAGKDLTDETGGRKTEHYAFKTED